MKKPVIRRPIIDFDDKDLAIAGLVVLGVASIKFLPASCGQIVPLCITGIAALATGRKKGE